MEQLPPIIYSLETIGEAAEIFWKQVQGYRHFAFSGQLGAGKTTFIHALCDLLQVNDAVSSPTFALINEYQFSQAGTPMVIYHMDWYRLRDEEEAINAGMEDALGRQDALCFIEWPEQAPALLTSPYIWIAIQHTGDSQRELHLTIR